MAITSALVLFAIFWFLFLFIALPIKLETQSDRGLRLEGTPGSAPEVTHLRRKFFWVTVATLVLWIPTCAIIISGVISVDDFDLFRRFGPDSR